MLNILLRKMYAEHFPKENVRKNAFLHQMHFCIKCIFAQLNIFLWKMYAEHFPLENVRKNAFVTFCVTKCTHQMHFCIKCILASNAFVTFCFAEHFPLENVRWTFSFGKCTLNIFQWKMYALPKCILASNAFLHQMHFGIKCIFASNAFLHQQNVRIFVFCKAKNTAFLHSWTFSFGKCMLNIFFWKMYAKMHFCIKCIFAQLNIFQRKMYAEHFPLENVRVAKMHFCIKCICNILCNKMYASNAFLHQMHL